MDSNPFRKVSAKAEPADDNPFRQRAKKSKTMLDTVKAQGVPRKAAFDVAPGVAAKYGQGATLGWFDEGVASAQAGYDSLVNDWDYDFAKEARLKEIRSKTKGFEKAHPGKSLAAEMAGGIVTGAAVGGQAHLAKSLPRLMGAGAVGGAVAGAGYGDEDRLGGAAMGAGIGAATPLALSGAKRAVYDPLIGPYVTRAVDKVKSLVGARSTAAEDYIRRAIVRDRKSPEQVADELMKMGDEAALVDVGPNLKGLGEAVAQRPGPGETVATAFAEGRRGGQFGRVLDILRREIPKAGNDVAVPLQPGAFGRALDEHIPITPDMRAYLDRGSLRTAWRNAQRLAKEENEHLPDIDDVLARVDGGSIKGVETRVLHWLKKGLDDAIEPKRDPKTGIASVEHGAEMLRAMKSTRHDFRSLVKELNPSYGKYLDAISADKRLGAAFDEGGKIFGGIKPKDLKQRMKSLDDREKRAYMSGIYAAIEEKLSSNAMMGRDVTSRVMSLAGKLNVVFGKDKTKRILNGIMDERRMSATENEILRGSQTARRLAGAMDFDGGVGDDVLRMGASAATGNKIGMTQAAVGAMRRHANKPSDQAVGDVADVIFNTDKAQTLGILEQLQRKHLSTQQDQSALTGAGLGLLSITGD